MKMDKVASSKNDEFYTPRYAITPILKYLKPHSTIWCPFDTDKSLFVSTFRSINHEVIHSHISTGDDFFNTFYKCDYIVSNPPYSLKGNVLERLFSLGTPFAMLVGVVGLFESQHRYNLFKNNTFEVLYLNKRVAFFKNYLDKKPSVNPPFSSVYVCHNMLPKQIVFDEIDKKNI